MGGVPCDQFTGIHKVSHTTEEEAGLVRCQTFTIEGIENFLNQPVGDFRGQVRFRKGSTV
jgi:hypothetical protein